MSSYSSSIVIMAISCIIFEIGTKATRLSRNYINFSTLVEKSQFLSRVSILTRDIDIANLSACLSIRYVPVPDENGLTYRHSFFHHMVAQTF